jgi:predicted small lipoprotein YifL
MKMRNAVAAAVAAAAVLGLAGCGETPQVTVYKQGKYQGKPDTKPWDSPQWGGDKAKWEREVNTRTLSQNEYTRTQ